MTRYTSLARLLGMVGLLIACAVLQARAENTLYIQPYLQNVTQTGMTIQARGYSTADMNSNGWTSRADVCFAGGGVIHCM